MTTSSELFKVLDGLYRLCIWIAGLAILLMALIVPIGVVMRYGFSVGAQWPEPIAVQLMMVFTFIGAPAAYRAGGHIAVTMLIDNVPSAVQHALGRLVHACMLAVCLFVTIYGARLCVDTMNQMVAELPAIPVGLTYLPIPLGALLTLIFVLENLFFGSQKHRELVQFGEAH